ncbi:CerR family C-terminal domain-containing protein [Actomonas aquatica]|uniref:CerR family C-terminal domain-containing protein n=1 Tax=Actomonas aquatica TaxID=2866162 RepID=A0ABZ1C2M5_9BACT|nr:CerR family C-terminal domain-containing protein [Opitutus sp. WL0086]WRQ85962.1 CerR family C-terminal domain-containing protein [Opitutus sp. WL0086]
MVSTNDRVEESATPPTDRRERRGCRTRQALVEAGLELFGEYGLKGTTTRMLCEATGANVAAINYHFGNKDGLYLAVIDYIIGRLQAHIRPTAEALVTEVSAANNDPAAARRALLRLLDHLADLMVQSEEIRLWALIIVREQSRPTPAFDHIYDQCFKRVQSKLLFLLGTATGIDPTSNEAKIRVHAFFGQILGFAVSRESLLRTLGTPALTPALVTSIRQVLHANVEACLNLPVLADADTDSAAATPSSSASPSPAASA